MFMAQLGNVLASLAGSGCHNPSPMVIPQFHGIRIFKFNLNLESLKNSIFPHGGRDISHLHSYPT